MLVQAWTSWTAMPGKCGAIGRSSSPAFDRPAPITWRTSSRPPAASLEKDKNMTFKAIGSPSSRLTFWTLAVLLAAALPAAAHPGHGPISGFVAGVQHPLSGMDHLLAMIAVGLWAGLSGGRREWLGAAPFVS